LTPEQLSDLRHAMPPFPVPAAEVPGMAAFCEFYRLDFLEHGPGLEHSVGTLTSGAYRLMVHHWRRRESTGTLLLVHGYTDHTGLYGKLVEYGLSRGFNVLIFDLPGHGLSSGDPLAINEFAAYGRAVAAVVAQSIPGREPLWVMAQSTGCAALVEFARIHPWPFQAAVLLAPLVRPVGWLRIRLGHSLLRYFTGSVPRQFNENSSDLAFLSFVKSDPLQAQALSLRWIGALGRWLKSLPGGDLGVGSALVIQGDRDATVDWRYNINVIVRLFPGSRVEYVAGGGHQLANESKELREHYYRGVDDYLLARGLKPLVSGSTPQS
jgi:lysophospholipase